MSLDGTKSTAENNQENSKYLSDGKMNSSSVDQHPKGAGQMCTNYMSSGERRKDGGCKVMRFILVTWAQINSNRSAPGYFGGPALYSIESPYTDNGLLGSLRPSTTSA